MSKGERFVFADVGMTESEAKALAAACTSSKNRAIKAFGKKLADAIATTDSNHILKVEHETAIVEDHYSRDDCIECGIEKVHTESNDELCWECLKESHPDHWAVKEAA